MKTLLFILCFGISLSALAEKAQSPGSEQQHQAAAGVWEATADLEYGNLKDNGASGQKITSLEKTLFNVGVQGEYGFTDAISAGFRLFYDSSWTSFSPADVDTNTHSKGMANPQLFVNGRINLDSSSFRIGTTLGISLADKYFDDNGDQNSYTGATWFSPYAGYEYYYGEHTFGVRGNYRFNVTTGTITQQNGGSPVSADITGGSVFEMILFYEYDMNLLKLGLDIQPEFRSSTTYTGNFISSQSSPTSLYTFEAYAPIVLANSLTIIPSFSYVLVTATDSTVTSSGNGWGAEVKARFAF